MQNKMLPVDYLSPLLRANNLGVMPELWKQADDRIIDTLVAHGSIRVVERSSYGRKGALVGFGNLAEIDQPSEVVVKFARAEETLPIGEVYLFEIIPPELPVQMKRTGAYPIAHTTDVQPVLLETGQRGTVVGSNGYTLRLKVGPGHAYAGALLNVPAESVELSTQVMHDLRNINADEIEQFNVEMSLDEAQERNRIYRTNEEPYRWIPSPQPIS